MVKKSAEFSSAAAGLQWLSLRLKGKWINDKQILESLRVSLARLRNCAASKRLNQKQIVICHLLPSAGPKFIKLLC